ncbi:MAG: caspase family protein, partial [Anaerolineales bacterium]
MPHKHALVIGSSEFTDPKLARLITPAEDATDLATVLQAVEIGGFDSVTALVNESVENVRTAIEAFFADKGLDDLLLLYFSGHGIRDDQGQLYLAVKDTQTHRLRSKAIPANFITESMDHSRSRRQVLILDCCHSG